MSKSDPEISGSSERMPAGTSERAAEPGIVIDSTLLMSGQREITILHVGERYRLRITANDKLILTK